LPADYAEKAFFQALRVRRLEQKMQRDRDITMDETEYMRSLENDPDNVELRSAYLKWLEARGDHRAEYIRLMNERARLEKESHEIHQRILQIDWRISSEIPQSGQDWLDRVYPLVIRSPITGNVYLMPAPDAAPFVSVGDLVRPESKVAIVDAMKIFNNISADIHGVISAVLATNGQFVEYNQLLFKLNRIPRPIAGG
jgi:biotin carboxyl carrier protein